MAVYFDHRIEAPESSGTPFLIAWHGTQPVLAVGSISPVTGGNVNLYHQHVRDLSIADDHAIESLLLCLAEYVVIDSFTVCPVCVG